MNICMDYCQSLVTEMQPEEIELQREGITYPEFHKYTYYSTTAERETGVNVLLLSATQQDTVVGLFPHSYRNIFTQNKIEHIWHFMTQTGHDHMSVKPHLYNFFRMIFKGTAETENLNTECM